MQHSCEWYPDLDWLASPIHIGLWLTQWWIFQSLILDSTHHQKSENENENIPLHTFVICLRPGSCGCLFVYFFFNLGHSIRDNTSSLCSSLRPSVHIKWHVTKSGLKFYIWKLHQIERKIHVSKFKIQIQTLKLPRVLKKHMYSTI